MKKAPPFGQKRRPSIAALSQDAHRTAMNHIVEATNHASDGRHDEADYHLESAITWAGIHHEKLKASGQHEYAGNYTKAVNDHVARVRGYRSKLQRSELKCNEDHSKLTKQCKCGYMQKSDLKKGFLPGVSGPPVGNVMRPSQSSMRVGKPKQDPRYDYKTVTELHPHDQNLAQEKWGVGTGRYEYPVDKQSGRLVHATRVESTKTPQALGSAPKDIPQQHRPGQSIRIQGHAKHEGRLGIVRSSHPAFPNKIAVQIGPSDHHKIYVEPHQVKLSKAVNRIEKALVTMCNIRKVFMK